MGNCDLDVLAVRVEFGDISGVMGVSVAEHGRRKNRKGNIENGMGDLKDMFASYLTSAVDMLSGSQLAGRTKMSNDLREIGKLSANGEMIMDLGARLG